MKFVHYSLFLASLAAAAPAAELVARQGNAAVQEELTKGTECKDVTFIWVRGTTEAPNMGSFIGTKLLPELRKTFPSLAVEGVKYSAGLMGNFQPGGAGTDGVAEATKDYKLAASKCPKTIITGGGYSQGGAITHRTIEGLPQDVKDRIAGIILYGDTQFKQEGGKIKGLPAEKVKTMCNGYQELKSASSDGVCGGMLNVNMGHISYSQASMAMGATFLKEKVDAFKKA